jgi:uncharacterized protein (TIGR02466 family)
MLEKNKLYRELWYPTTIYFKDIENSKELNKQLLKDIYKWKDEDEKGIKRSNTTGWHSAVSMHQRKEFKPLVDELFKMQNEIFKDEDYEPNTTPMLDNMWANVNYKYAHNRNHVHPGALWSGVYYIQCPKDCGNIWFTDPAPARALDIPNFNPKTKRQNHQLREVYYHAVEGRLIMFPGWLTHEVEMNMSNLRGNKGHRVSVSFNFKQIWKPQAVKPNKGGHSSKAMTFEDFE